MLSFVSKPYPRVASLKTAAAFRAHLAQSGIALNFDEELAPPNRSPLAQPIDVDGARVGNRFCILPMEGWDGTRDGEPSELTRRRWQRFGSSGAKLIWGGEAVAIRHDGRANPNQLVLWPRTQRAIASLREELVSAHRERFGNDSDRDLLIGLQLTHSGRYSRPDAHDRPQPLTACANPVLDRRFRRVRMLEDVEIDRIVDEFVAAARLASQIGFQFVDIKHCHGYLGHELLGARTRQGAYGGTLENRTRFMRNVISGIQASVAGLRIGVRLSVFDVVPHRKLEDGSGVPEEDASAQYGFGVLASEDLDLALEESRAVLSTIEPSVRLICVTAGSPYYSPHIQRPAFFPPSDGYDPPEDPLRGVARQIEATALLKASFPGMVFVGSAYSYLQEWLPHVAQHSVRTGMTDLVGLGRMVLAYPDLPFDLLRGAPFQRGQFCRTFSDCTTGPRRGHVSGCYPLDPFYAARPEAKEIRELRVGAMAQKP